MELTTNVLLKELNLDSENIPFEHAELFSHTLKDEWNIEIAITATTLNEIKGNKYLSAIMVTENDDTLEGKVLLTTSEVNNNEVLVNSTLTGSGELRKLK